MTAPMVGIKVISVSKGTLDSHQRAKKYATMATAPANIPRA